MEILNQFGFDLRLFAAQIVNFIIIVVVFKKFLYKPLLKTIKNREDKIAKGLQDAEKAQVALAKAEEQKDQIIQKASEEAERIISEAKKEADNLRDEMMEKTRHDMEKMMQSNQDQLKLEREVMMSEVRNVSLDIAKGVLQSTIGGLFDKKEQQELLKKGLQKIKHESKN